MVLGNVLFKDIQSRCQYGTSKVSVCVVNTPLPREVFPLYSSYHLLRLSRIEGFY